ncbi:MAG: helix-hairpin-helix domain-containing protein [Trichloromonadaceae bacterium]
MEMTKQKELQKIKGIGAVLAQRLIEAGIDSPAKLAEMGEEGLKQLRGINPRMIPAILEQAQALAAEATMDPGNKLQELQQTSLRIKEEVQRLVAAALENQGEKLLGKKGERLEKQLRKLLAGLEQANATLGVRPKRTAKGLAKIEKRLGELTSEGVKALTQGLKKARKPLKRLGA